MLSPWLRREHPGLDPVVHQLVQDHAMIGTLLAELQRVVRQGASAGAGPDLARGVLARRMRGWRQEVVP